MSVPSIPLKKHRVYCYVDGFNMYYAMVKQTQDTTLAHKKVNLWALAQEFIAENQTLNTVKYFSAYANHYPTAIPKHQTYVKLLENAGVEVIMGRFKKKPTRCKKCEKTFTAHKEKETDVRIAINILEDAEDDKFDVAFIISADSDLVPVVDLGKKASSKKECHGTCSYRSLCFFSRLSGFSQFQQGNYAWPSSSFFI